MIKLEKFNWDELSKDMENEKYKLLYMDYNRENGVRYLENISELNDTDRNNFYKIIIFNENKMVTIYNFGTDKRYSKIEKKDFEKESAIKVFYTDDGKRLAVRVGKTSDKTEIFQYIGFYGGEK